jgi:hypothetical protein
VGGQQHEGAGIGVQPLEFATTVQEMLEQIALSGKASSQNAAVK